MQGPDKRSSEQYHGPTDSVSVSLEPGGVPCSSRKRCVGMLKDRDGNKGSLE